MRHSLSTDRRIKTLSDWPSMLLTFAVCLFCWFAEYVDSIGFPMEREYAVLPFWGKVCTSLSSKVSVYLLGILFVLLSGYVIQRISDIEMLIRERTRLPFILFVLLISTNGVLIPFQEVSVVLLCMAFVVYELVKSYQSPEATGKLFNAGVLMGVACLFMPQMLWFIPLLWLGMYQFRSLSLKSWLASFTGLLMVYWFLLGWCLWRHDFSSFSTMLITFCDFQFTVFTSFQPFHFGFIGILLLLIIALVHIKADALNNSVRVRQMHSFLLNMSVWSLVMFFLYGQAIDSFVAILFLSGSIAIAYFLENIGYRIRFIIYYLMFILCVASFIMQVWKF